MKYLLKQNKEDKGILCDKVTIDGFEYYVSDIIENRSGKIAYINNNVYKNKLRIVTTTFGNDNLKDCKKIIACNNPNIDIPQVVDDVEDLDILKSKWYDNQKEDKSEAFVFQYSGIVDDALEKGIIIGYNKSQEMFLFTEEDMIDFTEWIINQDWDETELNFPNNSKSTKELLKIWKEQQPKVIYYE